VPIIFDYKMIQLQPTIDCKAIIEVKDLPVFWMSIPGRDITIVGNYVRECKARGVNSDPTKVADLIGGRTAHLRQTTLENGLRYVTIHLKDGKQIFNEHEFAGLFSCNCGAIHDSLSVQTANAIHDTDLGDGIKLDMTISGHNEGYGRTSSYAKKEFEVAGKKVKVHYSIVPKSVHEDGHLSFSYEVKTPGSEPITAKFVKLGIHTVATSEPDNKNDLYCRSSISVAHNLSNHPYDGQFDQMEFKFGLDGRLEEIVGRSQGTNPNPEWTDGQVLAAIKKGQNDWFGYNVHSPEAQVLSQAIFGQDVTQLRHNTRETLNAIMEATIKEIDIDVPKTLRFC